MGGVFISYRRDDSQGSAGRLCDDLRDRFGDDLVFRDIDAIEPGMDYLSEIVRTIAGCDVLVAVIGRDWTDARDRAANRRLDSPQDLVRLEIAAALEGGKIVIPVLIEDAVMPTAADLPEPLVALASRNALPISDLRWDYDVGRLLTRLEGVVRPSPVEARPPALPTTDRRPRPSPQGVTSIARSRRALVVVSVVAGVALVLLVQRAIPDRRPGVATVGAGTTTAAQPESAGAPTVPSAVAAGGGPSSPKRWGDVDAAVTTRSGAVVTVNASTMEAGGHGAAVVLESGQTIDFEKIRSIEITGPVGTSCCRSKGVVTLLTGEKITQTITNLFLVIGSNALGPVNFEEPNIVRVDFRR